MHQTHAKRFIAEHFSENIKLLIKHYITGFLGFFLDLQECHNSSYDFQYKHFTVKIQHFCSFVPCQQAVWKDGQTSVYTSQF